MKTFRLFLLGFMLLPVFVPAQQVQVVRQVIAAGGGVSQASNLVAFWTVGEFMTQTLRSADDTHILTQGFQQPEPHNTIVPVIEIYQNQVIVNVYPNPVTQFVRIVLSEPPPQPLTVSLTDVQGKLVATQALSGTAIEMDVSHLPDGAYFLTLSDENAIQGCVKILKTSPH